MICNHCGKTTRDGSVFCEKCGKRLDPKALSEQKDPSPSPEGEASLPKNEAQPNESAPDIVAFPAPEGETSPSPKNEGSPLESVTPPEKKTVGKDKNTQLLFSAASFGGKLRLSLCKLL